MSEFDGLWSALAAGLTPPLAAHRVALGTLPSRRMSDGTIVSRADRDAEAFIIETIREFDPAATVLAEEDSVTISEAGWESLAKAEQVWVVDPIDGTSQFLDPDGVEFCSVIALLAHGHPSAAMILAPELGRGRRPVILTADSRARRVLLNGSAPAPAPLTQLVSTTRSSKPPGAVERAASELGFSVKLRATSQTLDMARTVVDLEPVTDLRSFRCFAAHEQLLWDAAAGLTLAAAWRRSAINERGAALCPLEAWLFARPEPRLPTVILAHDVDREWVLRS